MIYLSGTIRAGIAHPLLGFINTPRRRQDMPAAVTWAADNGRFTAPHRYTDDGYLRWLGRQPDRERCLFATAPDVVGDHAATLGLSGPMLPRIRALGYPVAFVAQDGWREDDTPWPEIDVLFIGGTNSFKLGRAGDAVMAARRHGKQAHMGRVNSYRRLRLAALLGCNSADGTFLRYAPSKNLWRMLQWLDRLHAEQLLPLCGGV